MFGKIKWLNIITKIEWISVNGTVHSLAGDGVHLNPFDPRGGEMN